MSAVDSDRPWTVPDRSARIAALAERYTALQARGQDRDAFSKALEVAPQAPDRLAADTIERAFRLDHGAYWFGRLPADRLLRVANPDGVAGVSLMIWSARDPSERMNVHDSQKVQWTTRLARGRMLLSDMGRPLAQIVDDTCGRHDAMAGLPPTDRTDGSSRLDRVDAREQMALGALKLGLTPRDLHPVLTLFAPVTVDARQRLVWDADVALADGRVDIRATVDLLMVAVNAPHPLAPAQAPRAAVDVTRWRDEADVFAPLRALTPETMRAFDGWGLP